MYWQPNGQKSLIGKTRCNSTNCGPNNLSPKKESANQKKKKKKNPLSPLHHLSPPSIVSRPPSLTLFLIPPLTRPSSCSCFVYFFKKSLCARASLPSLLFQRHVVVKVCVLRKLEFYHPSSQSKQRGGVWVSEWV